jgi:hypothetical protein
MPLRCMESRAALLPKEIEPVIQCVLDWVGPRAGLEAVENRQIFALPEIEPEPYTP